MRTAELDVWRPVPKHEILCSFREAQGSAGGKLEAEVGQTDMFTLVVSCRGSRLQAFAQDKNLGRLRIPGSLPCSSYLAPHMEEPVLMFS